MSSFQKASYLGYRVIHSADANHPPFLSERHFEIAEPSDEQLLALADRILKSQEKKIEKIRKQEIVAFAVQHNMIENEELKDRIHDNWLKLIEKKKSRLTDHTSY